MSSAVLPEIGEAEAGPVSSLDLSAFGQCLNGAVDVINELDLPGVFAERVHVRWNSFVPTDADNRPTLKLPCIIVSPGALRPSSESTNRERAFHFNVDITIHRAGGMDGINQMGVCLRAWQDLLMAFAKKAGRDAFYVDDSMLLSMTVDSAEADNERARRQGFLVQFLRVDCLLRLPYPEGL